MDGINGFWGISFTAQGMPEGFVSMMQGYLIAWDGRLSGLGGGGSLWVGHYQLQGDRAYVDMVLDARNAEPTNFVFDTNGTPVKGPVAMNGIELKMAKLGTTLVLDGMIHHGPITFQVVATHLRDLL